MSRVASSRISENLLQFVWLVVRIQARRGFEAMAEPIGNGSKAGDTAVSKAVNDFVNGLSNEHRMLIVLKAQLYDGTWEPMLDDLRNRLAGKPYIFKLANRIKDDIERIEQLQKFEAEHNVDLADHVDLP
jgi:hypothetical protein